MRIAGIQSGADVSLNNSGSDALVSLGRLEAALQRATQELLAARTTAGHWQGELSSSALSTGTATIALSIVEREAKSQSPKPKVGGPEAKAGSNNRLDSASGVSNLKLQISAG